MVVKSLKVAVVGSRNCSDETYDLILKELPSNCSEIISGGAIGVDTLAKKAAESLSLKYICYEPDYKKYGKVAPILRNDEIADNSNLVLAFWDGKSKGTQNIILHCIKNNIPFKIIML